MTTIRLYGKLGARFGRVHHFQLDSGTPREAVAALSSQFAGFKEWLLTAHDRGLAFAVFIGKRNIGREGLEDRAGTGDDIRIAPVLMGAKGSVFQIIIGVILVIVGTYFHLPGVTAYGISMIVGGVVQMLSPQPKLKGPSESSNQASYVFNGSVNTAAQGHPVPLLYGRMRTGSAVVSAGIEAADYAPARSGVGPGNPKWFPKNFYDTFTEGN